MKQTLFLCMSGMLLVNVKCDGIVSVFTDGVFMGAGNDVLSEYHGRVSVCLDPLRTSVAGDIDVNQCSCKSGYFMQEAECVPCATGSYKEIHGSHMCTPCGPDATSLPGARFATECLCTAGHESLQQGACGACGVGAFKTSVGNSTCVSCPSNSSTAGAGKTLFADCQCMPGFSGTPSTCSECPVNTYKNALGGGPCQACPVHMTSPVRSTDISDCVCMPGYTVALGDGTCTACEKGTYKPEQGGDPCSSCPTNADTPSTGSIRLTQCLCDRGFTGPDGQTCTACGIGTSKSTQGSDTCIECDGVYEYTGVIGSPECQICPDHADANDEHSTCHCQQGYADHGSGCQACPVDTFKTNKGNLSSDCLPCPDNTQSQAASVWVSSCLCDRGYTADTTGVCVACGYGTYKNSLGSSVCTACPSGKYLDSTASSENKCMPCEVGWYQPNEAQAGCEKCPGNSTTSANGMIDFNSCVCVQGLYMSNGQCQQCPLHHYCTNNIKHPCNDNAVSPAGSNAVDDCLCAPGFFESEAITTDSMPVCEICTADHFCPGGGSERTECPEHSSAQPQSTSIDECVCGGGYREV